ncbi:MAG TPA: hypothetical protein VM869_20025 [Enhygromyxa sp.]|nr:hypothetical protein [Enhygromyxa sp.]
MLLPRDCTKLSIPLLTLSLSCTGDGPGVDEEEGEGETGDGDGDGVCTDPGMAVPEFDPFLPPEGTPSPTCSTGWASDAPVEDAAWVAMIEDNVYYYSAPPFAKALSDGAALLITQQSLQWFDGQGSPGAELEHGLEGVRTGAVVVRDADDHVFIAASLDNDDLVIREFADGAMVGELSVPTPGVQTRAIGLFQFSTDEWLIVGDEYDALEYQNEAFFMHVDASGAEVLRKARPLGYSYYYSPLISFAALDADDNLLFGSTQQQWLVDPSNGAVTNPGVGLTAVRDVVGSFVGAGFAVATQQNNASNDAVASFIDGSGSNQWTQVYDRALTGESFFDVDARPDGGFVAAGFDGIWWEPAQLQSGSQPMIIAFDEQGNAEWIGRLAIPGDARSVDVAADGGIVATGRARLGGTDYNDIDAYIWIASW